MAQRRLPKRLSLNGGVRKTPSPTLGRKISEPNPAGYERSFSGLVAALNKMGPREPKTMDDEILAITARIKREQKRIQKLKIFANTAHRSTNMEVRDAQAKLVRKESVVAGLMFKLNHLNIMKQKMDQRELHRRDNFDALNDGRVIRLENNKLVPVKKLMLSGEENQPIQMKQHFKRNKRKITKTLLTETQATRLIKAEKAVVEAKEKARKEKLMRGFKMLRKSADTSEEEISIAKNIIGFTDAELEQFFGDD